MTFERSAFIFAGVVCTAAMGHASDESERLRAPLSDTVTTAVPDSILKGDKDYVAVYEDDIHRGRATKLPSWYKELASTSEGHTVCLDASTHGAREQETSTEFLKTLGYRSEQGQYFTKVADLSHIEHLQESEMPELPEVDAIAISSVYRPGLPEQYVYRTLRSLFSELPPQARINVFVGSTEDSYMSMACLQHNLGNDHAARVSVVRTSKAVARFFEQEQVGLKTKATWNYARILRSYKGNNNLLLFEDDIELAKDSIKHLRPWLADPPTHVLVLFNRYCYVSGRLLSRNNSSVKVELLTLPEYYAFPTTQAVAYPAAIASSMGDYLLQRSRTEPYDNLIGQMLGPDENTWAIVHPSVVQHFGFATTGLSHPSNFPLSLCYQEHIDAFY